MKFEIVVSGCPRSGTSLMMNCLKEVYGIEKIMGSSLIKENNDTIYRDKLKFENDGEHKLRVYLQEKNAKLNKNKNNKSRDMNPNGFWECKYTVKGCNWHINFDRKNIEGKICKIVSQGLTNTNPEYVDKIIYMLRRPDEVAKSQERLSRGFKTKDGRDLDDEKINTPEMFLQVTKKAARWIKIYKPKLLIVKYEDLVLKPEIELKRIGNFINKDMSNAISVIDPKLYRSKPDDLVHPFMNDAFDMYNKMLSQDFEGVMQISQCKKREYQKNNLFPCLRTCLNTSIRHCEQCFIDDTFRQSLIKYAEKQNVDYKNEPCVYECSIIEKDGVYVTPEDSIKNNHWIK